MKVLRSGPVSWVFVLEQALGGSGCFWMTLLRE